ncbi:MAG: aconitase X catalytic domain-containing protein [Myxococcales bacterium]|nr:aconitase X catalytic domain-containing protein [Myxococcales bacterium]
MQLTREEQSMLDGDQGDAVRDALSFQIKVGQFWGARRFVPVTNAHMMGDIEIMGEGGLGWLRRSAARNAHCNLTVSTNARCVDFSLADKLQQDASGVSKEKELIGLLQAMNVTTADTCINYQTHHQPHFGERLAWGDTGAVIYANSVFGARSNFESGPAALAAGITQRVPEYGFHLDQHRRGTFIVNVDANLDDVADWGALGKLVGETQPGYFQVPVFTGISREPLGDELKHLGAALASFGSMAMFHMVGVTPEAPSVEAALAGNSPNAVVEITNVDVDDVYSSYASNGAPSNLVVFSGPQLSLWELKNLSERFGSARVRTGTDVFITTEAGILASARRLGYAQVLEDAGATIMVGVCFYILLDLSKMRARNGWETLVTNSAKLANVIGAHGFHTILRRTQDCVDSAVSGGLR